MASCSSKWALQKLGMTLTQLMNSMTYEELYLWSAYFANQNEDTKEMAKSARR